MVALNFSAEAREIDMPVGKILLSTVSRGANLTKSPLTLAPNEGVIVMLEA